MPQTSKLSRLSGEVTLPFWLVQNRANALKLLDSARGSKKKCAWLPVKVPLKKKKTEVKYKTRESWDTMSKYVYGKTYPLLSDVMENPSLVYPSQGHFRNGIM